MSYWILDWDKKPRRRSDEDWNTIKDKSRCFEKIKTNRKKWHGSRTLGGRLKKEVKAMQLKTEAERARTWRILTRGNAMQQHGIKGKQVNI